MTIFTQFGPPKILQFDNGREFVTKMITELKHIWTDLLIIHGRPRHPQSQGCIERANGDLEIKLSKWIQDNQKRWSSGLPLVVYGMNTSVSSTTKTTPYEIVFGPHPRSSMPMLEQLATQGIVKEEDLPIEILDTLFKHISMQSSWSKKSHRFQIRLQNIFKRWNTENLFIQMKT